MSGGRFDKAIRHHLSIVSQNLASLAERLIPFVNIVEHGRAHHASHVLRARHTAYSASSGSATAVLLLEMRVLWQNSTSP